MKMLTTDDIKIQKIKERIQQKKPKMITLDDPFVQGIIEERQAANFFNGTWQKGTFGNKRPVHEVLKTGAWKGRRCFVLGGGPSLKDFDFSCLDDELTIGVNRIYEWMDCTILFAMDGRFYKWILEGKYGKEAKRKFVNFNGLKIWLDIANLQINDVFYSRSAGRTGLSWDIRNGLFHGNNSGYGALNLALVLGANPIYLLGYDMKFDKGKGHFHSGHPTAFTERMMQSFAGSFNKGVDQEARANGIKIINANRNSALKCFEFGDLPEDLSKRKHPIYVSYYTNNGYQEEVKKLRDDIWQFSLRNDVNLLNDSGDWNKNCHQKPVFLKSMLKKYPRNSIVWLDADARIRRYPVLFNKLKCDLGIHYRKKKRHNIEVEELLSGTIYLANNHRTDQLMDLWIEENRNHPLEWDQRNLARAIKRWNGKVEKIPSSYCQIFDSMAHEGKPVIEHFQASRKLRRQKQ